MNCSSSCLNGGQCSSNGVCICDQCFTGTVCEVNVNILQLPLTALMRWDIEHTELINGFNGRQLLYILVIALMVIMSIVNTICSLATLLQYEIRQTNCGIYQILICIVSLINIILIQIRLMVILWFDYLTDAYAYRYIACDILPILHLVIDNLYMWIGTLLAIEFILLECFCLNLHRSRWLSMILSSLTLLGVFAAYLYIPIYRRPIPDRYRPGFYTCTYIGRVNTVAINKITLIIHLIIPTFSQLVATICILISITKRVGFVYDRSDVLRIFLHECCKRKHFFIPLIANVFFNLPHLCLHLRDECEDIRDLSILRLHIAFLFLGYTPEWMTFFIYIYPSTSYMKHFKETRAGRLLTTIFYRCTKKKTLSVFITRTEGKTTVQSTVHT